MCSENPGSKDWMNPIRDWISSDKCRTTKGLETISPHGRRMATMLLPIPTAFINMSLLFDKNFHILILTKKEPYISRNTNLFTQPLINKVYKLHRLSPIAVGDSHLTSYGVGCRYMSWLAANTTSKSVKISNVFICTLLFRFRKSNHQTIPTLF